MIKTYQNDCVCWYSNDKYAERHGKLFDIFSTVKIADQRQIILFGKDNAVQFGESTSLSSRLLRSNMKVEQYQIR